MPETWQMALSDFVGKWRTRDGVTDDEKRGMERDAEAGVMERADDCEWFIPSLRPSKTSPATWIVELVGPEGDVLALVRDFEGKWDTVAGYVGSMLWVTPAMRQRGLGAELVMAKADLRNGKMNPIEYTTLGRAAHASAHRMSVQAALREGMRVPACAILEHPDLAETGHS